MNIENINLEARALVDADTNSYTAADLLRRVNNAYEETVMLIQGCDGLWQFDDSNYTTFPTATTTLVAGQRDYSFDSAILEVERVAILHASDGKYHFINPYDMSQIGDPIETLNPDNGIPGAYDKQGSSIVLDVAPSASDVTLAAGLKVWFKRTASIFTSAEVSTGTKTPGFASPFHVILAYKAALPYAMVYKKDRVAGFINEIDRLERGIVKHYLRREQDRRKQITMGGISHR
jgi:hypothetical protein